MSLTASKVQTKAMELAQTHFGSRFKTYRNTPMLQVTPADLPVLGVYILRERRGENSHANHGEPAFKHQLTIGFSGGVHVETDRQNELNYLESWMNELDDVLLTNSKFVNLTEGIISMDRVAQFAKVGETTLYEIRVEMVMEFSSWWPPVVPDILEKVVVDTQFPDAASAEAGTPQIHREYTLETE